MRKLGFVVVLGMILGLSLPIEAQRSTVFLPPGRTVTVSRSLNSQPVVNVPIDTSNVVVPVTRPQSNWSLLTALRKLQLPGFGITHPQSVVPSESQFPGWSFGTGVPLPQSIFNKKK